MGSFTVKESTNSKVYGPRSFKLEKNQSAELFFLSGEPTEIYMRSEPIPGQKFVQWVPMESDYEGGDIKPMYFWTAVRKGTVTNAKGKSYTDQIVMVPATAMSAEKLSKVAAEYNEDKPGLQDLVVKASRSNGTMAPKIGDDFLAPKKQTPPTTIMIGNRTLAEASKLDGFSEFYEADGKIKYVAAYKAELAYFDKNKGIKEGSSFPNNTDPIDGETHF